MLAVRVPTPTASRPRLHQTEGDLVAFARALAMCAEGGALASWTVTCPWGGEIRITGQPRPATGHVREAA